MTVLRVGRAPEPFSATATYFDGTRAAPAHVALTVDEDTKALVGLAVQKMVEIPSRHVV